MSSNAMVMTPYQQYIHLSRYARYLPSEQRRERWDETVTRFCDFWTERFGDTFPREMVFDAIYTQRALPSMRALMTAGPALARDEIAAFNCSYITVDDPRAFDETLYVLMNGVGLGFSVERQVISKLPEVAEEFHDSDTVIRVADSKVGWAAAYRELISLLYAGQVPTWDLSKLRAAGAPLKTFGGRSSGPKPLDDLFKYTVGVFKGAAGRKLKSTECHDLMCAIASAVIVGGVRRSALISFSNLSDERMRGAKSGQWWIDHPERALANNSVAYTEKPDIGIFMKEWQALYESKSGERGLFNRIGAAKKMERAGRRDAKKFVESNGATNPCVTADTMVTTTTGVKSVRELVGQQFFVHDSGGNVHPSTEQGFWSTGIKPVFEVQTDRGYAIKATANHKVMTTEGWVEVGDLRKGDWLVLDCYDGLDTNRHSADFNRGWIVGSVIGDGCYNPSKYKGLVRYWGDNASKMATKAGEIVGKAPTFNSHNNVWQVQCDSIDELCEKYIVPGTKDILPAAETEHPDFVAGLISGLFDADGTTGGDPRQGGVFLQLSQSNRTMLQTIQRMLIGLGIASTIYMVKDAGESMLPDGKGVLAPYQTQYRLDIGRRDIDLFFVKIGFRDPDKSDRLAEILDARIKKPYKSRRQACVTDVVFVGEQEVYDCSVYDFNAFAANGVIVHNCGEIFLRNMGLCNLSTMIVRPTDTFHDLSEKVRIATIIGTFQSTLTNYRYVRAAWRRNSEEERLLGVSMTGIMDHGVLSGREGEAVMRDWLRKLKQIAVDTNAEWAEKIGINPSVAITTIKPEGCTTMATTIETDRGILSMEDIFKANGYELDVVHAAEDRSWLPVTQKIRVRDENNEWQEITNLYVRGVTDVFEITFEDGSIYKFTGNHKLKTTDGLWKRVDELTATDEIASF